jgi:TctA family transporter
MIVLGVGFGFGALSSLTGEKIEHSFSTMRNLVEMHSTWASITNVIAGILLVVYIGYLIQPLFEKINLPTSIRAFVKNIFMVINWIQRKQWILVIMAIILLGAIAITGALGAAIVHGPEVDPVVKYIYTLFVR